MSVEVSEKFMEMLVTRYSSILAAKETRRALRKYSTKHYNTRKLMKRLRKLHNDILTAEPEEIPRLRAEYLKLREQIAKIKEARDNDPVVQQLRDKSKTYHQIVARLDEAIVAELRHYGYEVRPMGTEEVEAKVRELIPEPREAPESSSNQIGVAAPAEPTRGCWAPGELRGSPAGD